MKTLLLTLAALALFSSLATAQDVCAPAKVTTLATTQYYGAIFLSWTATGDDCTTGNATSYEVRYSTSAITATNWCNASVLCSDNSAANGNQDSCCLTVTPCATTTYYFAVFLIDDAGNRSPISNVPTGAARCSAPFQTCP
jgi:hypothetical protein